MYHLDIKKIWKKAHAHSGHLSLFIVVIIACTFHIRSCVLHPEMQFFFDMPYLSIVPTLAFGLWQAPPMDNSAEMLRLSGKHTVRHQKLHKIDQLFGEDLHEFHKFCWNHPQPDTHGFAWNYNCRDPKSLQPCRLTSIIGGSKVNLGTPRWVVLCSKVILDATSRINAYQHHVFPYDPHFKQWSMMDSRDPRQLQQQLSGAQMCITELETDLAQRQDSQVQAPWPLRGAGNDRASLWAICGAVERDRKGTKVVPPESTPSMSNHFGDLKKSI